MPAWILVLTIMANTDGHSTVVTIPQSSKAVCEASAAAWLKAHYEGVYGEMKASRDRFRAVCISA